MKFFSNIFKFVLFLAMIFTINCNSPNYKPDIISLPKTEGFDKKIKAPTVPQYNYSYLAHGKTINDNFFWMLKEENKNKILELIESENQYAKSVMKKQKDLTEAIYNGPLKLDNMLSLFLGKILRSLT